MQEIILGAAIGLISSVITLIITNIFQSRRDNKARQWFLEDQTNERKRERFTQRANEAEVYIDQMYHASHTYCSGITTALLRGHLGDDDLETIKLSNQALMSATEKQVYIFYLNDPILSKNMQQLFESFETLRVQGNEALEHLRNPQYDRASAKTSIVETLGKIAQSKKIMILRLDELLSKF